MTKTRLNQYQRRQAKRESEQILGFAALIAIGLMVISYFALRTRLDASMYEEVIASSGARTLAQVQTSRLIELAPFAMIGFVVLWLLIAFALAFMTRRRSRFDFDGAAPDQAAVPSELLESVDLHRISPREFEERVAYLISLQGYKTQVCGGAGDGGIDVKVYDRESKLIGVVQCKRYNPQRALPPMFVREMATVKREQGVEVAYLATTAYFTEETRRHAKQAGVRLIDGRDLRRISRKAVQKNSV